MSRDAATRPPASTDSVPLADAPGELAAWVAAIHAASSEREVLRLALAGTLAWPALGAEQAFLLQVESAPGRGAELIGCDALGPRHGDERAARPEELTAWMELAAGEEFEGLSPELTGLVRTVRLPVGQGGDPAAACALDGRPRRGGENGETPSPIWAERLGVQEYLAVPVTVGGRVAAVLVVSSRAGRDLPGSPGQAALEFLVREAGAAVEGLRTAARSRLRRAQIETLREVVRGLCEPQGLGAALARLTQVTAQAMGARGAALWLTEEQGRALRLEHATGPYGGEENRARAAELGPLAEACVFQRQSPLLEGAATDARLSAAARGLGSVTGAPLVALGRARGALLVYGGCEIGPGMAGPFTREDQDLVALFAGLAALLVEQAGAAARLGGAERRYEEAERLAVRAQSLAQLGEISVRMAREMTSPLASIAGFARRVRQALPEGDPNREYLAIVVREGERLERLVAEHLQYAGLQRFHLGLVSINHIVQQALEQLAPELARKRVRLVKRLSPEVPALLLDAEKIAQALHNVMQSALEGAPAGGTVKVETRVERGVVVVETAHDGPPLAGDLLENLFVPFATGGRGGPGLGLALAQRIVRDHGGEIGVRREGDWGQILGLQLPVIGNEDRRAGKDRRKWGGDRRNRLAVA